MRFIKVISVAIIVLLLLTLGSCAQAPKEKSAPVTQYTDLPLSGGDVSIGSHDDEYGFHIVNRVEFTHPQDYPANHVAHSYQTLKTDVQKTIYDKVLDACYCFSDEKVEGDTTYKMRPVILDGTDCSPKEAEAAIIAVFDDHPEIFWMDYLFDIEYDTAAHTTELVLHSEYTAAGVVKMMQEIDDALAAFYREMPKELSAYEREVYVYKYIIDHCVYDENILDDIEYEDTHPSLFNLYGVMVDHVAVCEGYAYSFDYLCSELGIDTVLLFGVPVHKDAIGSSAWDDGGVVQQAVREIKRHDPGFCVITDVCLCEYTDHGHCGKLREDGSVDNDATLELLAREAVSHVHAGADMVAPSDMMDGRVGAIRSALDMAGFTDVPILSYAVKYASAYYGPFRDAAGSAPGFGDRRGYQMDPANSDEALREAYLDIGEGADAIMVKPALAYLDVLQRVTEAYRFPTFAYNVSGEYALVKAAAERGWVDERRIVLESLLSIKRAGACAVITYHAKDAARWLAEGDA